MPSREAVADRPLSDALLAAISEPAVLVDARGALLAGNARARHLLGFAGNRRPRIDSLLQESRTTTALAAAIRDRTAFTGLVRACDGCSLQVRFEPVEDARRPGVAGLLVLRPLDAARELEASVADTARSLLLRLLAEAPVAWAIKDSDLRYVACNPLFEQLLDKSRDELLGQRADDVVDPAFAVETARLDQEALTTRRAQRAEHVIEEPGRPKRIFRTTRIPLDIGLGVDACLMVFAEDITARYASAGGLAVDGALVKTILDYMPGFIALKDAHTRRFLFATGTDNIIGDKPTQYIVGKNAAELYSPALARGIDDAETDLLDHPEDIVDKRFPHVVDGAPRWFFSRKLVVPDREGAPRYILTFNLDITREVEAEQRRAESETFLRSIVQSLPSPLWVQEVGGKRVVLTNLAMTRADFPNGRGMLGRRPEEVFAAALVARLDELDRRLLLAPDGTIEEEIAEPVGGATRWHSIRKVAIGAPEDSARYILTIDEDVTDRRRMLEDLRRSEASLKRSQAIARVGSWHWDLIGGRLTCSTEMFRLAGEPGDRAAPSLLAINRRVLPEDRTLLFRLCRTMRGGLPRSSTTLRVLRADNQLRYLNIDAELERDADGEAHAVIGTAQDITERIEAERHIRHLAQHDPLTGLPNRRLFDDKLADAVGSGQRGERVALHCLDLNDFKGINDTLGHGAGDELLRQVADRLRSVVELQGVLARIGGDEFAVLQYGVNSLGAASLAQRISVGMQAPFRIESQEVFTSASIGIALKDGEETDPQELLRQADMALYAAKAQGRGSFRFFSPEMNAALRDRKRIEARLRHTLANEELQLAFQPQVELRTGRLIAVEALVRWHDAELGHVSPDRFIPVAEESVQILQLGEFVLRQSCRAARRWRDLGLPIERVAVNLSPAQFAYQDLVEMVHGVLEEVGLPAHALELEITEGTLMRDTKSAVSILEALHELGVAIALDDFGTGYSSLSYLKRFPLDKIKIDRSFVSDLPHDPDDVAIARTIITLAKTLGLKVIAEGVETPAQRDFLMREGCDEAQGYYFAKPMPGAELEAIVGRSALLAAIA